MGPAGPRGRKYGDFKGTTCTYDDVNIRHCLVKSSMNSQGPTTWADFRHEAGWSLEERYPRKEKYEREQYSIIRSEDISVYSVIFGVCSWVRVKPKGGLPPHTNTTKASYIALHPPLLHAPCVHPLDHSSCSASRSSAEPGGGVGFPLLRLLLHLRRTR